MAARQFDGANPLPLLEIDAPITHRAILVHRDFLPRFDFWFSHIFHIVVFYDWLLNGRNMSYVLHLRKLFFMFFRSTRQLILRLSLIKVRSEEDLLTLERI
jgi:hypothetical protein